MPLLLLLLSCSTVEEDRCTSGVEIGLALDDLTSIDLTGWEVLARAQAATAATLTWASGEHTALTLSVEAIDAPWECVADPSPDASTSDTRFQPSWHLPVRWTLHTDDGQLAATLDGTLNTLADDPDPWLQASSPDGSGVPLGDIDPAAWLDFEVVFTAILPESGSVGTVFAYGWQDTPDGADVYLEETLAEW